MTSPAVLLTRQEWNLLFDESPAALKLYLALRWIMDFTTGIAGLQTRLNEQALREVLAVPAIRGRHKPAPVTRKQIRHLLERLIQLGLLQPQSSIGSLVFRLPLAATLSSARNMRGQRRANEGPDEEPEKNKEKQDTYTTEGARGEADEAAMRGLPQEYMNNDSPSPLRPEKETPVRRQQPTTTASLTDTPAGISPIVSPFPDQGKAEVLPEPAAPATGPVRSPRRLPARPRTPITDDWQPSERCLALAEKAGIPRPFCLGLVDEFVFYWQERQEHRPGWDATFLNHAKRQWARMPPDNPAGRPGLLITDTEATPHAVLWQDYQRPVRSAVSVQYEAEQRYLERQRRERGYAAILDND